MGDEIAVPAYLTDIYTLKRTGIEPTIEAAQLHGLVPDQDNLIPVSGNEALLKGIPLVKCPCSGSGNSVYSELACSQCGHVALFIRHVQDAWLCPPCAVSVLDALDELRPPCCERPLGCDACGGIVESMITVPRTGRDALLLCARDQCLMPFGYRINALSLTCTCEVDIALAVKGQLLPELEELILDYLPLKSSYVGLRRASVLGDLTTTTSTRCLRCQIERRYTSLGTGFIPAHGREVTCSCFQGSPPSRDRSRTERRQSVHTPVSGLSCSRSTSWYADDHAEHSISRHSSGYVSS
jgi:hypothetical protein